MSDEERRKKERRARMNGDDAAAVAAVERDQARFGEGVIGFLDALVGQKVFVEGVRINYRGTLCEVFRHGDGRPAGLLLDPCQRVSYMADPKEGDGYTFTHVGRLLVPYEVVHGVGPEGFVGVKWAEINMKYRGGRG